MRLEPQPRGGRRRQSRNLGDPPNCAVAPDTTPDSAPLQTSAGKQRYRGRAFPPGVSGNPAGRRPGTLNKATREVRELARRLVEDPEYQESVQQRLKDGLAGPLEPLLWHYAYGKPKEVVDLTTTGVSIVFESTLNPDALRDPR
jgi:hypothetical protein